MSLPSLFIDGKPVQLGKRIGKGGEGEVYTLSNGRGRALKLYTVSDANLREPKIAAMLRAKLADRSGLIAFPDAIVRTKDGRFAGFTMRLVNGHKPLFDLYAPGARKINFPGADYRFLVRAALNIAKAVAEVHETSCVIGDINHSGILISDKAIAALIDADSFQISDGSSQHLCRVGVKEYTPPELHGQPLDRVQRSENHDAFGLAIVMFQLLFMGRHPFVGRYSHGEMPIEKAIAEHRFAYSLKRQVGMTPPPGAVTLSDFPPPIAAAFEAAFSGAGAGPRPTAKQWVTLLGMLEGQLKRCGADNLHYFPSAAPGCPWCRMEKSLGMVLFLPDVPANANGQAGHSTGFDIIAIWAAIEAVALPSVNPPDPVLPALDLSPSDDAVAARSAVLGHRATGLLALLGAAGILIAAAKIWILWIPLGIFGAFRLFGEQEAATKFRRRMAAADTQWTKALADWQRRCGGQEVHAAKKGLSEAKGQFQNLPSEERSRLASYEANRRDFQLKAFLGSFRIRSAKIRGIGPAKEASLASYGIDTAADISHSAIVRVPGFGTTSAQPLLAWRRKIEARFLFNPLPNAADARERDRIVREIQAKGDVLRTKLRNGPQMLRSASQAVVARWKSVDPLLARAYAEKEQAELDWNHVASKSLPSVGNVPAGVWVGAIILLFLVLLIASMGSLVPGPTPSSSPAASPTGAPVTEFGEAKRFVVSPKTEVAVVNLRSGPGGDYPTTAQVPAGEIVLGTGQVTGPDGTLWIAVTRTDGNKGYVAARLLKEAPAEAREPTCDASVPWLDNMLCSDGDAKAIDQEMRRAVASLRKALIGADRAAFDADQAEWMGTRQSCSTALDSKSCLLAMYRERIGQIAEWPIPEAEAPVAVASPEPEESAEQAPMTIAVPARLRGGDNLITADDYPASALRNGEQGVTTARFQVDERGQVLDCTIIVSSGSRLLDNQTCALITRRFRYDPARSSSGMPLISSVTKTVRWSLP